MRSKTLSFAALAVVLATGMFASLAYSSVQVIHPGAGGGTTTDYILMYDIGAGNVPVSVTRSNTDPCLFLAYGTIPGPRVYFSPCAKGQFGLYAVAGASADGGESIQSGPADTLFAGVGDPRNPSTASTDIVIERNQPVAGSIRLTFNRATIEANTGPSFPRIASRVTYRVLAYPTAAAANADPQRTGAGAVFDGTVDLHARGGSGSARFATGGFSNAEWPLVDTGTIATVTPISGLQKVIVTGLGDATNSPVLEIADPKTGIAAGVPGFSWPALVLLSLSLLGSGLWVIRSRRTIATA